ncbi:hypothetical protein BOTCAL_0022g00460 [Botryotinia calthae]|uniref:Uncharacterized protein n=1 Tax=Botryotinia calthae TaxID=38488 RepID=A0A4Y8DET0_9HELO|nr:hypothetical protein BOTCAL_0022g00460 [Botryotinia calthae]
MIKMLLLMTELKKAVAGVGNSDRREHIGLWAFEWFGRWSTAYRSAGSTLQLSNTHTNFPINTEGKRMEMTAEEIMYGSGTVQLYIAPSSHATMRFIRTFRLWFLILECFLGPALLLPKLALILFWFYYSTLSITSSVAEKIDLTSQLVSI